MCFVQLLFAKVDTVEEMLWEDWVTNKANEVSVGQYWNSTGHGQDGSVVLGNRGTEYQGEVQIITRIMQK
jgi:hypothetical protein